MKKLPVILILTLNLGLLAGQLLITSFRATQGSELADIQSDLIQLNFQNQNLLTQIYSLSSTQTLLYRAVAAGLVPTDVSHVSPPPVAAAFR